MGPGWAGVWEAGQGGGTVFICHRMGKGFVCGGLRRGGVSLPMYPMALHTLKCLHFPLK